MSEGRESKTGQMRETTYSRGAILFRALLYMAVAAMPELISALSAAPTAAAKIYWPLVTAKMVFAALVALRAFIDKSTSNLSPNLTPGTDSGAEAEGETG
jgi:hypothetical protein